MLKIKRLSDTIDFYDPYRVIIDGKTIMELSNGEIRDYDLPEGEHTIKIASAHFVSEELKFQMYEGEIVEFECKPDHKDTTLSKLGRKLFLGKLGIALNKKSDFYL